ncbi:hypothetical protein lbkm_3795 [Lachnospiraceae bacterium KM106-2]|nr:hypothetical protein lbkm_3795 [Lachnospiraceae bacterium KM106-2]
MATWSKIRQQLESFMAPSLEGVVKYTTTSYKFAPDKSGKSCITVNGVEVFRTVLEVNGIRWYQTETDLMKDDHFQVSVTEKEMEQVRQNGGDKIPEERIKTIAINRRRSECAKKVIAAQGILYKSNFHDVAGRFLTTPIEQSLESEEILLNVLAILDRRVGKKRLEKMKQQIEAKHSIVQYFYQLRCNA